jgi:type II secretory pathway pseudopilin PulG
MHHANDRTSAGRRDDGFTILETVIALFIAMVIGFGAISLFLFSANFNAGAGDRARALALAQQYMETYRGTGFDDLATADTTEQVKLVNEATGESDERTFTVNRKVANDAAVTGGKQKVITVTVTPVAKGRWTGGGVTLVMLRASDDIGDN